ncbi:ABC transporter permease subunit [Piscinibacter sp. XHJ-5]|uniref:ABC transporter permease subunit n=1 Tax=Piscinibacter sp. XHJ-5 TaxID=3037797 RepID=UPI002453225A|nr:ABC transporter permease subunit [Piscinibacter sp. XHJ-5]
MIGFVLRRAALIVPTFVGVTLLAFSLIHLIPGDPVLVMAGERRLDPVFYAEVYQRLGLDRPLHEQYFHYLSRTVRLDLGESFVTHAPVWTEFATLFPATVELSLGAMLFATVIGIPAGITAAARRGSIVDHGLMGLSLAGFSMPIFWWGLLLVMHFSVHLREIGSVFALPVSGRVALEFEVPAVTGFMLVDTWLSGEPGAFRSALAHLVLPSIVLGTIPMAAIARMTRSSMLDVLGEDYVRTARAKGLPTRRVVFVHALRNALLPQITVLGLQVGTLLGGAVLTETIFSWPGVGKWLIDAIARRDYPVLQGGILLAAALMMCVNLIVDVMYGWADPRIRRAGRSA